MSLLPDKMQMSKFGPPVHIYAVTRNLRGMRRLRLLWGVRLVHYGKHIEYVDEQMREAVRVAYAQGLISREKDIIFTSGTRNIERKTNIVGVFHVADLM